MTDLRKPRSWEEQTDTFTRTTRKRQNTGSYVRKQFAVLSDNLLDEEEDYSAPTSLSTRRSSAAEKRPRRGTIAFLRACLGL